MRVPFADVGPVKIPDWMRDKDAVLLTDAAATGYFGAQLGEIAEGDTVVVLKKQTDFLGADVVIEAVGAEADGNCLQHVAGAKLKMQGGSPVALNWAIDSVRKGGNIAVVGAYVPVPSAVKFGEH